MLGRTLFLQIGKCIGIISNVQHENDNPLQISPKLGTRVVGTETCNPNQYLRSMLCGFGDKAS